VSVACFSSALCSVGGMVRHPSGRDVHDHLAVVGQSGQHV